MNLAMGVVLLIAMNLHPASRVRNANQFTVPALGATPPVVVLRDRCHIERAGLVQVGKTWTFWWVNPVQRAPLTALPGQQAQITITRQGNDYAYMLTNLTTKRVLGALHDETPCGGRR